MQHRPFATATLAALIAFGLGGAPTAQGQISSDAIMSPMAIGSLFTYQGSLMQGDAPANAPHEFRFILYDSESGGSQVGATLAVADVPVANGVFTVPIDFGLGVFDGRSLWLEVAVRPNGSAVAFTTLSPRQLLTAAPYASYSTGAWNMNGNGGTEGSGAFLGTTDGEPLIVKTSGFEALRVDAGGSIGIGIESPEARLESVTPLGGVALLGSSSERGVVGRIDRIPCEGRFAVGGCAGDTSATGVSGSSTLGIGVNGLSRDSYGVAGRSTGNSGLRGSSETGLGVDGYSQSGVAVHGFSNTNNAVQGFSGGAIGVLGDSPSRGVVGTIGRSSCPGEPYGVGGCAGASGGTGVLGRSDSGIGVRGFGAVGVQGDSPSRGVIGTLSGAPCAGDFAVGGCSGSAAAVGVYGYSSNTAAMWARSDSGDLFVGVAGAAETRRARIDINGRGYFNGGTQTGGADYAESMRTTDDPAELEPGDVLALDPETGYAVRLSREANSRLVAGVYSTRPSILAIGDHHIDDSLAGEVPVALLGVVPTKVSAENGPIQIGDLLVSAALPGHAMLAVPDDVNGVLIYPTGAILGKALEAHSQGTGLIKVLVTLR